MAGPKKDDSSIINDDGEEEIVESKSVEDIALYRKRNHIRVYVSGDITEVPAPLQNFTEILKLMTYHKTLLPKIQESGYKVPTPIQMQAIPIMLSGRDLIACAPTGSGKTVAFVLPTLQKLYKPSRDYIRALVISPTRELAQQIHREFTRFAPKDFKIVMLSKSNVAHPVKNYDVLISTPLRLVNAVKQGQLKLDAVQMLVVDEADKLFDLGFIEQIDEIFAACTLPSCQKSLFSATIDSHVEILANTVMKEPIRIVIGNKNAASHNVDQKLVFVGQEEGKIIAIKQLIQQGVKPPVLVFTESIERAKTLYKELSLDKINVDVIHSERTPSQRDEIIKNFRCGKVWILIATELLGRGLDFKGVNLVINYDFPRTVASYIHRIGRTGRAGRKGQAVSYFTREDAPHLRSVAYLMKESGCAVQDWMLQLPKQSKRRKPNAASKQQQSNAASEVKKPKLDLNE